jgi:hypothetical protein
MLFDLSWFKSASSMLMFGTLKITILKGAVSRDGFGFDDMYG